MRRFLIILIQIVNHIAQAQSLKTDNPSLNSAFKLALETIDINTRRGILAAGADYGGEWTRDISINSWNAVSFLRPRVAENSLWSVTLNRDSIGHQYWDKIIWTLAAYHHYLIHGDKDFLKQAYFCSENSLKALEKACFEEKDGLFRGPSVFNDGIAGYPEPIYEPGNYSSSVLDHKNSQFIKCLSTNCIYYGAYISLAEMGHALKLPSQIIRGYIVKAESLKTSIRTHFYNSTRNTFNYLIDQNGKADSSQEALGISLAIILGIINQEESLKVFPNLSISRFGITSIFPDFKRYSSKMPGRHNTILWPMVNGFFAKALIYSGNYDLFTQELFNLIHLALDEDKGNYNFREIYNPYSGKPDGGYQDWGKEKPNFHWESCHFQTWSATAYVDMVLNGIVGLRFEKNGLRLSPFLPKGIHFLELKDMYYHGSTLQIKMEGEGQKIKSYRVNGKPFLKPIILANAKGIQNIQIQLENEN